jgi:hypothetical protein
MLAGTRRSFAFHCRVIVLASCAACGLIAKFAAAQDEVQQAAVAGQRVFTAGHSLLAFMPPILSDIAVSAKTLGSGKIVDELNHLLQVLAWEAVTKHPLSGVKP